MSVPSQVMNQVEAGRRAENGGEPQPGAPAAVPREQTIEYWQHRVKTLEGMIGSEGLREANAKLQKDMVALQAQMAEERAARQKAETEAADARRATLAKGASDRIESLGDEDDAPHREIFLAQQEQITGLVSDLRKANTEIAELKANQGRIETAATSNAVNSFDREFQRRVPDWKSINIDPGFIAWVGEVDQAIAHMTGERKTRQDWLTTAHARGDVDTCVNYYEAWKAFDKGRQPPEPGHISPPEGGGGGSGGAATSGRIWTVAEFNKLTRDATQGKISEEEYMELSKDYEAAHLEGRVRSRPG